MALTPLEEVFTQSELEQLAHDLQPRTLALLRRYMLQSQQTQREALSDISDPTAYLIRVRAAALAAQTLEQFCDLVEALQAQEAARAQEAREASSAGEAVGRKP